MNKKIFLIFFIGVFIIGCAQQEPLEGSGIVEGDKEIRNFYLGIVPTPKNSPNPNFEEIAKGYEEAGEIAEVAMIWVDPSGIGQYEKLKQNQVITAVRVYEMKPVLTLSFATIKEIEEQGLVYLVDAPEGVNGNLSDLGFRELWVEEAKKIAEEFQPEYFSLGNEINDYFYLYPDQLEEYLSLYWEGYEAIKEVSPDTMVFVVFSYTHLIDNEQYEMLETFCDKVDLIGITTYPWKHYENPSEIPEDYYEKIENYCDKPVAFTEIGWISSEEKGSSDQEQAEFLTKFMELTEGMEIEMVNWLFLHEVILEGIIASISDQAVGTIALKNIDGSEKEVYHEWVKIEEMQIEK